MKRVGSDSGPIESTRQLLGMGARSASFDTAYSGIPVRLFVEARTATKSIPVAL